ncbi:T7SS effector LXG polymorphic toxin [uncultured Metabacillus sp.]|uniref:ribonuclease YeeF family protein n=1 Tax=uncultured Metabacillus sp. TaxID=2860135 RepID=UPI0026305EC4|nr:T7SS effector LXG polymorphic toxin [uncultured Metabacillus sp.]
MTVKVYEAKSLVDSMEARAKSYTDLREKLEEVKNQFNDIVNLNDQLQGKGADAIKGFYQAQIDVVDAWLRLIDRNIAFFNGIAGTTEDAELSGDTIVHVPFLEYELTHHARTHKEMVSSQQDELKRIFNRIDDLISLDVFSKERFEDHMEKAEKDRKDTVDAVEKLDSDLKSEYILSEGDEQYVVALFGQLMEASRQGSTIQPIHFNAEAYKASEVYQLKEQAEKQTSEYLSFKEEQEKWREELKRQEELENRPWYEKTWDGIKTFTGEITGYYDYIRASEGVDPVTGEKLTVGQRVAAGAMAAAGFIPIVGWAGRIAKGGTAIYRTAKGMHAADQALDIYRTANTFSTLEKAEMGIYGLVSANGFSEYLTGKDMFGNELTEEQKQNSLYQALGILAIGGMAYAPQLIRNGKAIREQTVNKAHELALKTKAGASSFIDDVKNGAKAAFNPNVHYRFASDVSDVPVNAMDSPVVKKEMDGGMLNSTVSSVGKGADDANKSSSEVGKLSSFADSMSPEDGKRYTQFWDKVEVGMNREARVAASQMNSSSFINSILPKKLKEHNLSYDEFTNLRLKPDYKLTASERSIMQDIRDSVPRPDKNTSLIKNFHEKDIQKYLDGDYTSVKGFVAKAEDSSHIHEYSHVRESMRLDYSYYDDYNDRVVTPYPEDGNSYGYIEFKAKDPEMLSSEHLEIPYGHNMEKAYSGWEYNEWPWTGNGFTASRNGEVIPEWTLKNFIDLREGAKLHRVVDGKDEVIAIFNGKVFIEN